MSNLTGCKVVPNITQMQTLIKANDFCEMDERQNEFVATLAHEIRNPLAPIKNGLQLLALMGLSEEAEVVRSMMARQVEQIVRLIDNLLDISRIGCGKVLLDKQVCTARSIVEAAIEASSILISESGMKLEVIDNSNAACICGDRCRLTQVICNLLSNSAKFGRDGGKVSLKIDVSGSFVVIQVKDDGDGISSDKLTDIFKMYSQIDSAQRPGAGGLGIGLAVVRNLVELHGGFVSAESDGADCGSTFYVRLPITAAVFKDLTPANPSPTPPSNMLRVMVVDDLRAMRVVTEQLLRKLGHDVRVAEDGEQALAMMETFQPDTILSDISMPGMGGYEFAKRVRENQKMDAICLVALTGYGQSTDRDCAFQAGFDRHLTKPVNIQHLQELLAEIDKTKQERTHCESRADDGFSDSEKIIAKSETTIAKQHESDA